jgi:hypothetical protein
MGRRLWVGALLAVGSLRAGAAGAPPIDVHQLLLDAGLTPSARLAAVAAGFATAGIPTGLQGPADPGPESAVALVSLTALGAKAPPEQWVVRLGLAPPAAAPSPGAGVDVTRYTSVGDTFVYHSAAKAPMGIEILPPGEGSGPLHNRAAVSRDFLRLDLYRTAEVVRRIHAAAEASPGKSWSFNSGTRPYDAAEAEANRRNLERLHMDVADRRSFTGSILALTEFFQVIEATPGLDRILLQVIEKPGVMDVVRHGGDPGLSFTIVFAGPVDAGDVFWAGQGPHVPTDLLGINAILFGRPVLTIALVLTPPAPPFEVTAGVLGAVAWGPAHPDRVVVVRLLAAHAGP